MCGGGGVKTYGFCTLGMELGGRKYVEKDPSRLNSVPDCLKKEGGKASLKDWLMFKEDWGISKPEMIDAILKLLDQDSFQDQALHLQENPSEQLDQNTKAEPGTGCTNFNDKSRASGHGRTEEFILALGLKAKSAHATTKGRPCTFATWRLLWIVLSKLTLPQVK